MPPSTSNAANLPSLLDRMAGGDVYRLIIESLEDGVYLVDSSKCVVYWNDGAEQITGYRRQDVVGRPWGNLLVYCSDAGFAFREQDCPLATTLADGHSRRLGAFLKHRLGYRVPVSIRAAAVRDAGGAIVGAVEIFHVDSRHYGLLQKFSGLEPYGCLDLTIGLPNRAMTEARLRHRLEDLATFGIPLGLFSIVIGDRAAIEARGGRGAWSGLLRTAAQTLAETMEPNGFVGCWDGRFVGLLGNTDLLSLHQIAGRVASLVHASHVSWWGDELEPAVVLRSAMAEPGDTPESAVARLDCPPS
jgi:PAS domain S-box-containing protein